MIELMVLPSVKPQVTLGTGTPHTVYLRCDSLVLLTMHSFGGPAMEKENTDPDIAQN